MFAAVHILRKVILQILLVDCQFLQCFCWVFSDLFSKPVPKRWCLASPRHLCRDVTACYSFFVVFYVFLMLALWLPCIHKVFSKVVFCIRGFQTFARASVSGFLVCGLSGVPPFFVRYFYCFSQAGSPLPGSLGPSWREGRQALIHI